MTDSGRQRYAVAVERNVPAQMRDGVTLYADVFRPDAPGRFPVLLSRIPYGKNARARPGTGEYFAERGYVTVVQDTRARFASEGTEYYPLIWDIADGYDTVEWASALPWSSGAVGTLGQSYWAAAQYLLAPTRPPHLRAAFPISAPADFYQSWAYQKGGAFQLGLQIPYIIFMAWDSLKRTGLTDDLWPMLERDLTAPGWGVTVAAASPLTDEAFMRLPLMYWAEVLKPVARYLGDYLKHPDNGPYWWYLSIERQYHNIDVPMYHVTSWYDIMLRGGLANFQGLRRSAMTEQAGKNQKLLVGPWAHLFPFTEPTSQGTGDIDFGPNALIDLKETQLRWFDYWLKGLETGICDEPPVRLFVMGENVWRSEQEWPLARTRYTEYYIHSQGQANTLHGDGTISPTPPGDEPPDHFVYDPDRPVPTRGGNTLIIPRGVMDQRPVEERDDVLVFTGARLTEPLEVTGPIILKLFASTSGPDTDFTAKLVDVLPDGYARNVTDGIVRGRYRTSEFQATLLVPDSVYEFTIDVSATSYVFLRDHMIRLEISSSNFPRFDRNLNTGEDQATGTRWQQARQTVYHKPRYASHVVLPVIPR